MTWNEVITSVVCILCILHEGSRGARSSYQVYSRTDGKHKIVNYTISNELTEELMPTEKWKDQGKVLTDYHGDLSKLSNPEECARECENEETPRICYYHWTVEYYRTMGRACKLCQPSTNTSLTNDCQCILADGVEIAGIMVINRMYPGPSIQVCLGDLVVIDVINRAHGSGLTIHFHGIYQNGYQYYDGVPFVTQCPISFGSTFRYKWRAQNSGTHFYHAHTGLHKSGGVEGAIVIRSTKNMEVNAKYYDEDGFDNVIFISDWFHSAAMNHWPGTDVRDVGQVPDNLLINGRGKWFNSTANETTDTPLAVINVESNRRYRFRMINGLSWTCSIQMTIQDHDMTLIATDGEAIIPIAVTTINSYAAERYDFILDTSGEVKSYWIHVRGLGFCKDKKISQYAILRYSGSQQEEPQGEQPTYDKPLPFGVIFNEGGDVCEESCAGKVYAKDLRSAEAVNQQIIQKNADVTLYIPFKIYKYSDKELFTPHTYKNFEVPLGSRGTYVALLSNFSNEFPASPFLTQRHDVPAGKICRGDELSEICKNEKPCFCFHLLDIPLNSIVEIITIDEAPDKMDHPFHLHGYGFHVMGQGTFESMGVSRVDKRKAMELDRKGLLKRNFDRPPVKDTLVTPTNGYAIIRFLANNPVPSIGGNGTSFSRWRCSGSAPKTHRVSNVWRFYTKCLGK
ncbi:L-ascorbate oxidase isoform X2 [Fopius arisanus]|uniref:L-ascorbate oxidase isoform X2 n=1 Tax=Fopius arisanus TaxID=64838 RepID=A0A9R1T1L2_9HYME|nr:PREDICTED: L-ascorbate oxidase-like isoform X2 [Fopius arisanus]